jgi:hypothetical protein
MSFKDEGKVKAKYQQYYSDVNNILNLQDQLGIVGFGDDMIQEMENVRQQEAEQFKRFEDEKARDLLKKSVDDYADKVKHLSDLKKDWTDLFKGIQDNLDPLEKVFRSATDRWMEIPGLPPMPSPHPQVIGTLAAATTLEFDQADLLANTINAFFDSAINKTVTPNQTTAFKKAILAIQDYYRDITEVPDTAKTQVIEFRNQIDALANLISTHSVNDIVQSVNNLDKTSTDLTNMTTKYKELRDRLDPLNGKLSETTSLTNDWAKSISDTSDALVKVLNSAAELRKTVESNVPTGSVPTVPSVDAAPVIQRYGAQSRQWTPVQWTPAAWTPSMQRSTYQESRSTVNHFNINGAQQESINVAKVSTLLRRAESRGQVLLKQRQLIF